MTLLIVGAPLTAARRALAVLPGLALLTLLQVGLQAGLPAGPVRQAEAAEMLAPGARIENLAEKCIGILKDKELDGPGRRKSLRKLLNDAFDLDKVSSFVLGRYVRQLDGAQRAEFRQLFEDYLIVSYVSKLETYSGESLAVRATRDTGPDSASVTSSLLSPGGDPIDVDWHMRKGESNWRIVDIVIENISLVVTIRSEFTSVIQTQGGVPELLARLRRITARMT